MDSSHISNYENTRENLNSNQRICERESVEISRETHDEYMDSSYISNYENTREKLNLNRGIRESLEISEETHQEYTQTIFGIHEIERNIL